MGYIRGYACHKEGDGRSELFHYHQEQADLVYQVRITDAMLVLYTCICYISRLVNF
jgi:hypothetical protein